MSADECPLAQSIQVKPCVGLEDANTSDADALKERKRKRMRKELDGLIEDNAGKTEMDKKEIWRKMEKYLSRNDEIAME